MGEILKKMAWRRDTFVVSSKVFWGGKLPNQIGLSRKCTFLKKPDTFRGNY